MTKVVEIIDVDALSDSSSSDSDIVLTGFKRNPAKSQAHTEMLETEGFVYTGFNETPMPPPLCKASSSSQPLRRASHSSSKTPESDRPHAATAVSRISTGSTAVSRGVYSRQPTERHTTLAPLEPTKRSPSTFNPGRPTKRQKLTHVPTITNPQLKRERSVMKSESRKEPVDSEVICISDSEDEQPAPKKPTLLSSPSSRNDCTRNGRVVPSNKPTAHTPSELEDPMDVDQQEEEDYATAHAALDLDYRANVSMKNLLWRAMLMRLRASGEIWMMAMTNM
ncbi:hypothetical protein PYCCODRAFT_1424628 [Trametes coccinea BRFM310]|uniref:Uncharacterized protein n=1 Tax=Trametes coccinea (strain BRFM310) TaxID=1353009 RepID=A0A1Y2IR26_TRAC3|nr:hypothetical protein PYCCODRAFT_1424628 [Trametes coccinea BRFM310]